MADTPATETPETETPAAPVETPPEGETPATEAPVETPPAEGSPEAAKATEAKLTEDAIKLAAAKYATDTLKAANKTMAAARRAEARAESIASENSALKSQLSSYENFVTELKTNPFAAIRRIGFNSAKEFIDHGIQAGGEPKPDTADDRVSRLEKLLKEREDKEKATQRELVVRESKAKVAEALSKDTNRWDLVTTELGQDQLWDAIEAYHEQYGRVPDEAVYFMADEVEKALTERVSKSRKFSVQRPDVTKQGATTVAGKAAAATSNGGKTLTNDASGAPRNGGYSLDPEERRKQVMADMRAAGEL